MADLEKARERGAERRRRTREALSDVGAMTLRPVPKIPKVGTIHGLDERTYHADPCEVPSLSSSLAHILVSKSPAHAWLRHPKFGGRPWEGDSATERGSLIDHLLLGGGGSLPIARIDADNYRTKRAQEARDAARAQGLTPMLARDVDDLLDQVRRLRERLDAHGVVFDGASQLSLFWIERADDGTEVQCRGRLDHFLATNPALVWDLKTCHSAHPRAIQKHVESYGYDIQCVAYRRAVEKCFPQFVGRVDFEWLFFEKTEPHPLVRARPTGSLLELGERRWRKAINTWATCLQTGEWPGYADGVVYVEASHWALEDSYGTEWKNGEVAEV